MQKMFFLIIILYLTQFIAANQKWENVIIDKIVCVEFPVKPEILEKKIKGINTIRFKSISNKYLYTVLVYKDIHKIGNRYIKSRENLHDFYFGYIKEKMEDSNIRILFKKDLLIKGYLSKHIYYETRLKNKEFLTQEVFLYLQDKAYSFKVNYRKGEKDRYKVAIDKFIKSIKILTDPSKIKQCQSSEFQYSSPYKIGKFIGTLLPFLFIFFIIRIIYKSVKNKGKNIN